MILRRSMASKPKLNPRTFPRPPLCEKTPRHIQIKWNNELIADTNEGWWVLETFHPPTYYLPPSSIKVPLIKQSNSSYCEWKGQATYWSIAKPGEKDEVVKSRVYSYDRPTAGFKGIKDYISFYASPFDCYVDGEKVEPQPGGFYAGWVTSDIDTRYMKGGPGTLGW